LRILIVTNLYPDARLPAFGTFVAGHAEALRRAGADVDVVATTGIPVHTAVLRKYVSLTLRTVIAAVASRMRRRRPDVVEAHVAYPTALLGWIAARIAGARLVVYSHGSDVTAGADDGVPQLLGRSRFHHRLARRVFHAADLLVANSEFIAGQLISRFGVNPGRVAVVSPGIDYALFSRASSRATRSGILFVGRLASGKGVHQLLEAVARLEREVAVRFVGDGPEREGLERAARDRDIRAEFAGAVSPAEVAKLMGQAAVVAMPSVYPEGLGLVALEAMAAGALVVASASGGIGESVIQGQTGWLVPAGDVGALESALREALAMSREGDSAARLALLRGARRKARSHDVDAMALRTLELYRSLEAQARTAD
jgi:glycosyltransferase involved in cell wall biosynthesis